MAIVVEVFPTPLEVPAMTTVRGQEASLPATIRAQRSTSQPKVAAIKSRPSANVYA